MLLREPWLAYSQIIYTRGIPDAVTLTINPGMALPETGLVDMRCLRGEVRCSSPVAPALAPLLRWLTALGLAVKGFDAKAALWWNRARLPDSAAWPGLDGEQGGSDAALLPGPWAAPANVLIFRDEEQGNDSKRLR